MTSENRKKTGATPPIARRMPAQLDTVFEDVQMMWFDGAREPGVVPVTRAAVLARLNVRFRG